MDPVKDNLECDMGKLETDENAKIIAIVFSDEMFDIENK